MVDHVFEYLKGEFVNIKVYVFIIGLRHDDSLKSEKETQDQCAYEKRKFSDQRLSRRGKAHCGEISIVSFEPRFWASSFDNVEFQ